MFSRRKVLLTSLLIVSQLSAVTGLAEQEALLSPAARPIGLSTIVLPEGVDIDWGSSFGARHLGRPMESAQLVEFKTELRFDYQISPYFSFHAQPGVKYETGRTEYFYSETAAENTLTLEEAYVNLEPIDHLDLHAGAYAQRRYFSPLLVGVQPFPSAGLGYSLVHSEDGGIRLSYQRAVPTSSTLSSRIGATETLPTLDSVTLEGELKATSFLLFRARGSYFDFRNISSQVAHDSTLYGNSVSRQTSTTAEFDYGFSGLDTSLEVKWQTTTRLLTELSYFNTTNQLAPQAYGNAYATGIKESYRWLPNFSTGLHFEYYNVGPDSTISFYGGGLLGKTNRRGYGVGIDFAFPESLVRFTTDFYVSRPKFEGPGQHDEREIVLGLEMFNELI